LDQIMIARLWTGTTRAADADAYQEYVREVTLPGYANVTGNRAVPMLRPVRSQNDISPRATTTSMAIMAWPRIIRPPSALSLPQRPAGADPDNRRGSSQDHHLGLDRTESALGERL
jgi:hypothetical protein